MVGGSVLLLTHPLMRRVKKSRRSVLGSIGFFIGAGEEKRVCKLFSLLDKPGYRFLLF